MWCALAVGCCEAVKTYCIDYANQRHAFGEPISHRQSIAFMIADMAIEIEAMRLLLFSAASLAEAGQAFHREAYLARLLCAESHENWHRWGANFRRAWLYQRTSCRALVSGFTCHRDFTFRLTCLAKASASKTMDAPSLHRIAVEQQWARKICSGAKISSPFRKGPKERSYSSLKSVNPPQVPWRYTSG